LIDLKRDVIKQSCELRVIIRELYTYFLARLLHFDITANRWIEFDLWDLSNMGGYKNGFVGNTMLKNIVISKRGYSILSDSFLCRTNPGSVYFSFIQDYRDMNNSSDYSDERVFILTESFSNWDESYFFDLILSSEKRYSISFWVKSTFRTYGPMHGHFEKMARKPIAKNIVHYSYNPAGNTAIPFELDINDDCPMLIEYKPADPCKGKGNLMLQLLKKYIPYEVNGGWIPFDIEERKRMYPRAYNELKRYI